MLVFDVWLIIIFIVKSQGIEVVVQQGTLLGTRSSTVFNEKLYYAFYGVPYARMPVGKLRFKDPKPVKKWKKPYDARTEYHGACAQVHIVHKHALFGYENCLNLNIYTPELPDTLKGDLKAVIVWIHGYAFTSSFSHIHGPDFLIENDVLFISLTHRIGVFGFVKLKYEDTNANMGLKDIVIALKWIRRNINKFGGDKNKITIMGSGSAATMITLLMSKYKKLFSKAILQSGSFYSPSIFQGDYNIETKRLINKLKDKGIVNIVKASAKDLALVAENIYTKMEVINFQKPVVPFTPIIEKKSNRSVISEYSYDMYKETKTIGFRIPILIGFNSQESMSEVTPLIHNTRYLRSLNSSFKYMVPFTNGCKFNQSSKSYKRVAKKIRERYFSKGITEESIHDFLNYATDLQIYPIYKFIKKYLAVQNNLFVYKFDYEGNFNVMKTNSLTGSNTMIKGAAGGDEICYILKCEPLWENYFKLKNDVGDRDRIFIQQIAKMWASFAKFGDPHHNNGNVTWPPMTVKEDNLFVFGKENKLTNSKLEKSAYKFWNNIYSKYYAKENCEKIHDEL
ncbi:Esterase FE4 [Papilio machaon]|uniref:Esterase FE4 n=1 Tax=Papilio machaon TaxID=76193 RepID=A0A194QS43_PAPMA|nr:Esterase FE4 [Papilio machaon]